MKYDRTMMSVLINMKSIGIIYEGKKTEAMTINSNENYIEITLDRRERKLFSENNMSSFICDIIVKNTICNQVIHMRADEILMSVFIDSLYYAECNPVTCFSLPDTNIQINNDGNIVSMHIYQNFNNTPLSQVITFTKDLFEYFIDCCYFMFLIDIDEGDMTKYYNHYNVNLLGCEDKQYGI